MIAPPIPCAYVDGAFRPLGRFREVAAHHFGEGEIVTLAVQEERSEVSHRHEFAWLREAWATLPESLGEAYPSPEHLRKRALIATGWCTTQDYVCGSKAEADRWRGYLHREIGEHAVVIVSEGVVRVHRARSQARGKMNRAEFQASKTAIMEWVAGLLGVSPDTLSSTARGEAKANNLPSRAA